MTVTKKHKFQDEVTKVLLEYGVSDPIAVAKIVAVMDTVFAKKTRQKKELHPGAQPLVKELEQRCGYILPNYPQEIHWANWMLNRGYTQETVMGCYEEMKSGWWATRALSFSNVAKEIGNYVKRNAATRIESPQAAEIRRKAQEVTNAIFGSGKSPS